MLITADPKTAQRADNLLRALAIGSLQAMMLMAIGALGNEQIGMLTSVLGQHGGWDGSAQPYRTLLDLVSMFAVVFIWLGFALPYFYGRLGGRISGWAGRPMRSV